MKFYGAIFYLVILCGFNPSQAAVRFAGEKKLNGVVSELLEISSVSKPARFTFSRSSDGWIFVAATFQGNGTVRIFLDKKASDEPVLLRAGVDANSAEAMHYVKKGKHRIAVEFAGKANLDKLVVRAIPELIHCGLGFNPAIKSYGLYDLPFLAKDILPNITTLIVPHNLELAPAIVDDWHRQGKRFIAEAGINAQATNSTEHFHYWTGLYDKAPFLDGIIINEFIINNPMARPDSPLSPERQKRAQEERARYLLYEDAILKMRADDRHRDKLLYTYFGGSGKKLNQEIIGTNLIRIIASCNYRVVPERYLFEKSTAAGSREALQTFVEGLGDWEAKEPGIKKRMVIAFGLFSMPPGGINKQPDVDYHVWMDQQMNVVANHPTLAGIDGFEWWTSTLADEETVRFVGKLYRHYAIEGRTNMLTSDPLFLTHLQNPDFEKGTEGWTLHPAENGTIDAKHFPRYGRIEGRYMGLGRPADPEHIGDTFLWMKRSEKGPNTFSQTIQGLEPGRLYSLKMFSCDYDDLIHPKSRKMEEATPFLGNVTIRGVDIDTKRSFREMYASTPEPKIPVWITYHWKVFRAKAATAQLMVSDWPDEKSPGTQFGQEQTFNFLELQPYHE